MNPCEAWKAYIGDQSPASFVQQSEESEVRAAIASYAHDNPSFSGLSYRETGVVYELLRRWLWRCTKGAL